MLLHSYSFKLHADIFLYIAVTVVSYVWSLSVLSGTFFAIQTNHVIAQVPAVGYQQGMR